MWTQRGRNHEGKNLGRKRRGEMGKTAADRYGPSRSALVVHCSAISQANLSLNNRRGYIYSGMASARSRGKTQRLRLTGMCPQLLLTSEGSLPPNPRPSLCPQPIKQRSRLRRCPRGGCAAAPHRSARIPGAEPRSRGAAEQWFIGGGVVVTAGIKAVSGTMRRAREFGPSRGV